MYNLFSLQFEMHATYFHALLLANIYLLPGEYKNLDETRRRLIEEGPDTLDYCFPLTLKG